MRAIYFKILDWNSSLPLSYLIQLLLISVNCHDFTPFVQNSPVGKAEVTDSSWVKMEDQSVIDNNDLKLRGTCYALL